VIKPTKSRKLIFSNSLLSRSFTIFLTSKVCRFYLYRPVEYVACHRICQPPFSAHSCCTIMSSSFSLFGLLPLLSVRSIRRRGLPALLEIRPQSRGCLINEPLPVLL
jgi:hypothetical protein